MEAIHQLGLGLSGILERERAPRPVVRRSRSLTTEQHVQLDIFEWMKEMEKIINAERRSLKKEPWSARDIELLHAHLLEQSLRDLRRKTCPTATRREILQWVNRPIIDRPLPFSFQACCLYERVNPETLQEIVLQGLH